jgi:predicted secreted protein
MAVFPLALGLPDIPTTYKPQLSLFRLFQNYLSRCQNIRLFEVPDKGYFHKYVSSTSFCQGGKDMTRDIRSGKVVLVAHCVLNQNSRVLGLACYPATVNEVVDLITRHNIGIVQMPCPELTFAGLARESQTKEQYDTPQFRRYCRKIAKDLARQIQEYLQNGIRVLAILGVKGSPSCGVSKTSGILIEELKSELKKRNITLPFRELDFKKIAAGVRSSEKIMKT